MVNYICQTCLYVGTNEYSFKKLDKMKPVLEMLFPEIKTFISKYRGKYSLICKQCYYFLEHVEKFKEKCIKAREKLYTINLETVRDNQDTMLTNRISPYSCDIGNQSKSPAATSITLTNLLDTPVEPVNKPQLFCVRKDSRECAIKPTQKEDPYKTTVTSGDVIMNYCDELEVNSNYEDENVSPDVDIQGGQGIEISDHTSDETDIVEVIKNETNENENPGFFNKQSSDGFYKCRLCQKRYKTSRGLFRHTKEKHSDQIKIHHCNHCSFFSLWKSALTRHCSAFHKKIFKKNTVAMFMCYHCQFECSSKELLNQHISDKHILTRCPLCRARFSNDLLFAQHLETEHIGLDMSLTSNFCSECRILFLTEEDYRNHRTSIHVDLRQDQMP